MTGRSAPSMGPSAPTARAYAGGQPASMCTTCAAGSSCGPSIGCPPTPAPRKPRGAREQLTGAESRSRSAPPHVQPLRAPSRAEPASANLPRRLRSPGPWTNICSCIPVPRRSCTPTSTRSSPRSSSATTRRSGADRCIVGGGVVLAASYEAKAFGVRTADGNPAGAPAVPVGDRRPAPLRRVHGGEQGRVRGLPQHDAARGRALDRRSVPRRRRAPTRLRHAHRDRGAAAARGGRGRSGSRSPSASRARSSSPRSRARSRSPMDCWSCSPRTSARSCIRSRSNGCGESGRRPPRSCTRGITTVGEVAELAPRCSPPCWARPPAIICTPLPTTAIRAPCRSAGADAPSARSTRSAARGNRPTSSTRSSSGSSIASRPDARPRDRVGRTVVLRLRFDDFTRWCDSFSHPARRPRRHTRSSPRRATCSPRPPR